MAITLWGQILGRTHTGPAGAKKDLQQLIFTIRNRDRSIHWQTLKYENFMLEPETWTIKVMEFLEADTGDKALVNKCLQSTKEDSQAKSVLSKSKMKETKKVTAGRLPQNFQEIADETFTKFGLPTTTQFDKLFM